MRHRRIVSAGSGSAVDRLVVVVPVSAGLRQPGGRTSRSPRRAACRPVGVRNTPRGPCPSRRPRGDPGVVRGSFHRRRYDSSLPHRSSHAGRCPSPAPPRNVLGTPSRASNVMSFPPKQVISRNIEAPGTSRPVPRQSSVTAGIRVSGGIQGSPSLSAAATQPNGYALRCQTGSSAGRDTSRNQRPGPARRARPPTPSWRSGSSFVESSVTPGFERTRRSSVTTRA